MVTRETLESWFDIGLAFMKLYMKVFLGWLALPSATLVVLIVSMLVGTGWGSGEDGVQLIKQSLPWALGFSGFLSGLIVTVNLVAKDRNQLREITSRHLGFISGDVPPYKVREGSTPNGDIWRFRVQLQNMGPEQLTDCAVILEGISPVAAERFIARRLKLATDNPPDTLNMEHKQSFSLSPLGGKELIDVCQVDTRPGANRIRIFIATEGHRDLQSNEFYIPRQNCIFSLKAEAHRGSSCGESFVLEVNHPEPKFLRLVEQTTP